MKLDRFLIAGAVVACLGLSSACNSNQNTDSDHLVIQVVRIGVLIAVARA